MIDIRISQDPLQISKILELIEDPIAGGIDIFVGTVRNQTKGRKVDHLEFEAYEPMAVKEMHKIASAVVEKWDAIHICIHHRVGKLGIGEIPVIIGVSCAHRAEAFEACKFAIDTLKDTVPIWKKEIFRDGEVWVSAHP